MEKNILSSEREIWPTTTLERDIESVKLNH